MGSRCYECGVKMGRCYEHGTSDCGCIACGCDAVEVVEFVPVDDDDGFDW